MHQGVGKSVAWVLTAQGGQGVGMLCFGFLSDRVGRRPSFAIYSLLTAAAVASLAYRWEVLSATPVLFWLTMLLLGFGSGCTAGFGALLAELFPTEIRSLAMGGVYNCARMAQIVTPVIVQLAVSWKGLSGGLSVPMLLAIGTGLWVWTLPETRGIVLPKLKDAEPTKGGSADGNEVEQKDGDVELRKRSGLNGTGRIMAEQAV